MSIKIENYHHILKEEDLSIATVENIHTLLHPTFKLAVRDEIIRSNPTDGVLTEIKKKAGKNKGVRRALTLEQQRAFLQFVAEHPVYYIWLPLLMFLFDTGARIGEAIGIRWKDLDIEGRSIDINHTLSYFDRYDKDRKCGFAVFKPKTQAGERMIPMLDEVYDILSEEYEEQKENGFCTFELDGMTGFIFSNRNNEIHKPQSVNRAIERIRLAYNTQEEVAAAKENREPVIIPHLSAHHIRHTFCTRSCEH